MERASKDIETLKKEVLSWFDTNKAKILVAIEQGMRQSDLEDLLRTLESINSEHNNFNDFIPNSVVRKMMGVDEDKTN